MYYKISVFVRQSGSQCGFSSGDSWVVLSPIEQRIKAKIEAVGTPLKDWDVSICRGILTGYNEAFIISGEKREELIRQDSKSEEIIRPILRGRDVKRYGYEFADLWLINSHNGIKERGINRIDIEDYPAVKKHLDKYYSQLVKRADKGDTPYNLRNCAYTEDFSRPKIVWKRVGSILRFSYDEKGYFALDSTCFATGKHIKYLVAILNSRMGKYLMKDSPKTGTGDLLISVQAIEPLKIPLPPKHILEKFEYYIDSILLNESNNSDEEKLLDDYIYKLYDFNEEEIKFINSL